MELLTDWSQKNLKRTLKWYYPDKNAPNHDSLQRSKLFIFLDKFNRNNNDSIFAIVINNKIIKNKNYY